MAAARGKDGTETVVRAPMHSSSNEIGALAVLGSSARELACWARRRPAPAALAMALVVSGVAVAAYRSLPNHVSDLLPNYLAPTRRLLFEGKDLDTDLAFNSFSPFFYAAMAPLAMLPDLMASLLWSLTQLASIFVVAALMVALLRRQWPSLEVQAAIPLAMATPLILNNLALGQSNLLPLALAVLGAFLVASERPIGAGMSFALAVAFKITPALVLGYFGVLKLRWRTLLASGLGLTFALTTLPSAIFGPDKSLRWLSGWWQMVLAPFLSAGTVRTTNLGWHHTNQSLEAALQRHLTPYGAQAYGALHAALDPALLDAEAAHLLANLARGLIFLGLLALAVRWRKGLRQGLPFEVALTLLAIPFISPVAWTSHYVMALPAYFVAVNARAALAPNSRWRAALTLALVAAVGMQAFMASPATESFSPIFLGHFLLFGVLLGFALFGKPARAARRVQWAASGLGFQTRAVEAEG